MESNTRPALEVADILRAHGDAYRASHPISLEQAKVMRHLLSCRTAALGGHVDACNDCGYRRISYNSCRDRHCPKCQNVKRAEWLETRLERLLPVEYFHVVFTLPQQLQPVLLQNQRLLYDLLFQAASQTLLTLAADPKRLGAQIGVTAILHTWGQNLMFHPHLHCVVTGGGLAADGSRWIAGRAGYFLPVKVLGRLFRGKFLARLKQFYEGGQLSLSGSVAELAEPDAFRRWLSTLYRLEWQVYAKAPFGGAEQVFRYLGRYSHRVAISNNRLLALEDGSVFFRWKDYADDDRVKVMRLTAEEFLRRFLLHVLPKRFIRIRHYGLLAARNVAGKLAHARQLLGAAPTPSSASPNPAKTWLERLQQWTGQDFFSCPRCQGTMTRQPLEKPSPMGGVSTPINQRSATLPLAVAADSS